MLTCQREQFSLPRESHYINCAYMSPLLKSVEQVGLTGLETQRDPSQVQPADFFSDCNRLRDTFARLINAASDRIAILPSTSYGIAAMARNVPLQSTDNVVLIHEQFPSNVYIWRRLARESGAELRIVQGTGADWTQRILDAMDTDTAAVALGTVHWATGAAYDIRCIAERARDLDTACIVDGTQSVGALPFDVSKVQPDALICAGYKWLLGPYGLALMYVGDRFLHGVPLEENWITRRGSEEFATLVQYRDEYQPGAIRFDAGQRSNLINVPMQIAALEQIMEWGPEQIQAYTGELMRESLDSVCEAGYQVTSPTGSHLFGVHLPGHVDRLSLSRLLQQHNVSVSVRGEAIRVSPHVYNTPEDAAAFQSALLAAAK